MPILLWVIFPYVMWSACVDLVGTGAAEPTEDPAGEEKPSLIG